MASCLDDIVGIHGYCSDTVNSGALWLNDLTGISIQNADAAINSEQQSGFQLLQDKKRLAIETIKQDVRGFFADKIKLDSLIDSDVIGLAGQNLVQESGSANYKGIQLRFDNYSHAEIFISSVRLQVQSSQTVTVLIFDLITGLQVGTFDIDCVAGEVSQKVVNLSFKPFNQRMNLVFVYDATGIDTYNTLPYGGVEQCCGAYSGYYHCGYRPYWIWTRAISIGLSAQKIQNNLKSEVSTGGLSITYSLICSVEPLLCQVAPALAYPLLHKTGQLILEEMRYSNRLNSIVTLHKKEHQELWDLYQGRYQESMEKFFLNMRLPNDPCYRCDPKYKATTVIP